MDWRSHAIIGAVLAGLVFWILGAGLFELALVTVFAGLSALAPDLDHDSSKGRQWLDLAFIGFAFLTVYGSGCGTSVCLPDLNTLGAMLVTFLAMAGIYFLFFRFLKPRHRGITHTLAATVVFAILLYFIVGRTLALAGLVGYFSHLVADQHIKMI